MTNPLFRTILAAPTWRGVTILCGVGLFPAVGLAGPVRAPLVSPHLVLAPVDTGSQGDTLAAQLATVTTDTGAFAPGHRDWSRYETLDLCLAAARDTRQILRRSLATQARPQNTMTYDTVGNGGTALVARACGARFTLRTTATADLPRLFTLAIAEQNDSLVQAVLPPLIASQGGEWVRPMKEILEYGWRPEAEALVAQVDAQGPSARWPQFVLHLCLWNGSCTVRRPGETLIGSAGALDSLAHVLQFGREVLADAEAFEGNIEVYRNLMNWAAYNAPDSIPVFAVRARHDLDRFQHVQGRSAKEEEAFRQVTRASADALMQLLAPSWFTFVRAVGGPAAAPRLQADYWFPAPGHPASDTIRPAPGHVNLICTGGMTAEKSNESIFYKKNSADQAHELKDLMARYGSAGLTVTLVRIAAGYQRFEFRGAGLENYWRAYTTPVEEAHLWQWYAQTYEGLPVTVAVQVQHDSWLPDGRRYIAGPTQFNAFWKRSPGLPTLQPGEDTTAYGMSPWVRSAEAPGECVVTDRDGMIVYADSSSNWMVDRSYLTNRGSQERSVDGILYRLFHRVSVTDSNRPADAGGTSSGTSSSHHTGRPSVAPSEARNVQ